MKFNVNVEVTDAEIKEYAYELLLKAGGAVAGSLASAFDDPQALQFALAMVQQGIQAGVAGVRQRQHQQRGPVPATTTAVPGGMGFGPPPPWGGYPPGAYGPGVPPGPYGPGRAYPYPYGPPPGANGPAGPAGPDNVRPIQPEPAQVEQCFRVEANKQQEEGIACCHCAAVNAMYRTTCRTCGHQLCYVGPIVTPAPQGPPPPQVQGPQVPLPTGGYAGGPVPPAPQGPIGTP